MARLLKHVVIVILLVSATLMTAYAISLPYQNQSTDGVSIVDNYPYITDTLLKSNRYTQPGVVSQEKLDYYHDNYYPTLTEEEILSIGFEKAFENDRFILYFDHQYFAVMIRDKDNGYVHSSRPFNQSQADGNVLAWRRTNSGVIFDYMSLDTIDTAVVSEGSVLLFANATPELQEDAPVEMNYNLRQSSYRPEQMGIEYSIDSSSKTIHTNLKFNTVLVGSGAAARPFDIGFEFDIDITLTDRGIDVYIDKDSIIEKNPTYKLLNISVFPFLGAAKLDYVPGYFVIPDGIGALVRLNRAYNTTFTANYYGNDRGYATQFLPELLLPIYGIIQQEGDHGFYAHINEGSEHTRLYAQFWGNNSRYHTIYNKYHVRNLYRTVIDRVGNGVYNLLDGFLSSNYDVSYEFLQGDEASYVGLAKAYQSYLVSEGILARKETGDQIPIQTSYIMSDRENAFIGTTKVTMTTTSQVKSIYSELEQAGINHQTVVLHGWSEDGFVSRAPYRSNLVESASNFKDLANFVKSDSNDIFIENDYFVSSDLSNRVNYNFHVTFNIAKVRNVSTFRDFADRVTTVYYLNPAVAENFAKDDSKFMSDIGGYGLLMSSGANNPYSYYENNTYYDRTDFIAHARSIAVTYPDFAANRASFYMLQFVDHYFDMDIAHSGFNYYTDLAPILPIVLKGYLPFYTPYLNYNALGKDRLLSLIDFGMNPSYILTYEPTYKMKYTNASMYFTTEYAIFKDQIIDEYHYVNNALKHVVGESIVNREVLALGVVKVTYSNGAKIYINYSNQAYNAKGILIQAQDYEVIV